MSLLEILACPSCRSPLRADEDAEELVCTGASCGLAYPVRDDIPVLLVEEARSTSAPSEGPPGDESESGGSSGDDVTASGESA